MQISGIHIYPVKSLKGISLNTSKLSVTGLEYDRQWMLVDENGAFITQRSHKHLAQFQVNIENDLLSIHHIPSADTLTVPIEPDASTVCTVKVWGDQCQALDYGKTSAEFFNTHLKMHYKNQFRLVKFDTKHQRSVPEHDNQSSHTYFADQYPLLILSQESLEDLNCRIKESSPDINIQMQRFRPNIIIKGVEAYAEDQNKVLKINQQTQIILASPCKRCVLTTIDPDSLIKSPEPLFTLSKYKTIPGKSGVYFGQNGVIKGSGSHQIKVGDPLKWMN